jgi:DNA-binding winged helix-turn-helix (wHTH) protein
MSTRFGDFRLDLEQRLLTRSGEPVPLGRKAFDLLELLVSQRPRVLAKEQIRDRIWPKVVVSESTLNGLVAEVRAALGDESGPRRYIRTVHGFGYAFAAEAATEPSAAAPLSQLASAAAEPARTARLSARLLWENRLIPLSLGVNVLGRDEDVDVRIDAPSVSRRHACITVPADEPARIQDMGSKNGTWIGARRVEQRPEPLEDGDTVRLGRVELVFLDSKEKGSTQTA